MPSPWRTSPKASRVTAHSTRGFGTQISAELGDTLHFREILQSPVEPVSSHVLCGKAGSESFPSNGGIRAPTCSSDEFPNPESRSSSILQQSDATEVSDTRPRTRVHAFPRSVIPYMTLQPLQVKRIEKEVRERRKRFSFEMSNNASFICNKNNFFYELNYLNENTALP